MRYSIGSDDLIWLLRVAGENGSPHTLKEILADIQPIVEPVDTARKANEPAFDEMTDVLFPSLKPE